jgi:hypothetical protein
MYLRGRFSFYLVELPFQQEDILPNMAKRFVLTLNTEDNPDQNKTEIPNDCWFRLGNTQKME